MDLAAYAKLRPCLWHLTTRANWIAMRKQADGGDVQVLCTRDLHAQANDPGFALGTPRAEPQPVELPWGSARVGAQRRLVNAQKRLSFPEGWDLGRYCAWLDDHVWLWPGTADGPSTTPGKKWMKYQLRQADVPLTFLQIESARLLDRLGDAALFTPVGLGPAASKKTTKALSPDVLVPAGEIGVPSDVVEVAFRDGLTLHPDDVTPVAESRMRERLGVEAK